MLLVSQPTKESAHEFHGWWKTVHISPPQGDPHQSSRELRQIWNPCLMTYLRIGHLCLNRSWRILLIAHQHPPLESNATHEGNKQNNDGICTNLMSVLAGEAPGITSDCEASEELLNNLDHRDRGWQRWAAPCQQEEEGWYNFSGKNSSSCFTA